MLDLLSQIITVLAVLLIIPAFITAIAIIKEFSSPKLRSTKYYKWLLLQTLIYSLLLVAALYFKELRTAFLVHSFAMLPLFALLLLRLNHLKWKDKQDRKLFRAMQQKLQRTSSPKRPDLKRLRIRTQSKSNWR